MAGSSMTFSYQTIGSVHTITADWVSDSATGAVSGTTRAIYGDLLKGVTNPGTAAPTADYDITLSDAEGANILGNCFDDLIDRHTSNTETVDFFLGDGAVGVGVRPVVAGTITIAVAAAGNSKTGRLIIYYRPGSRWRGDG